MGILPIILTCFCVKEMSAYSIIPFKGITGREVTNVRFDAAGNTYVVTTNITYDIDNRFYKLNPSNQISFEMDLHYRGIYMVVSSRGDAYFYFLKNTYDTYVGVVKANSTEFEIIDEISSVFFRLDNNDNLFYANKRGVHVIRPDSYAATPITKLEDYSYQYKELIVSDKLGNTYMPIKNKNGSYYLAIITKEALQEEKPYATFIDDFQNTTRFIGDMMVNKEETLWIALVDENMGVIKRFVKGNWKTVITDKIRIYNTIMENKEKTYITAGDSSDKNTKIYFITSNDDAVEIPELTNLTADAFGILGLADSEGQVYFYAPYRELSSSLGRVITIKPDNQKPIPITVGRNGEIKIKPDYDDDMWIINGLDIYHLKKGKFVADIVENSCYLPSDFNVNFITKMIYIPCANGLFIVTND